MSMSREQFMATSGAEVHKLEFWLEQRRLIPEAADRGTGLLTETSPVRG
jgi:hypothetical protein